MGMSDEEEELQPTPEQVEAYAQRAVATLALGRFSAMCGALNNGMVTNHARHADCIVIPEMASQLALLDMPDGVGLAAPKAHAAWMDQWPYDCIVATGNELIFVSREYEWMQSKVQQISVSVGTLPYSSRLNAMVNQPTVKLYELEPGGNKARLINAGRPIKVFHSIEDVPIIKTREHYEQKTSKSDDSRLSRIESHFSG